MVKIYLQKGLSSRVRNAIARRLQSAMAVRPEAEGLVLEEGAAAEVPTVGVEQAAAPTLLELWFTPATRLSMPVACLV